MYTCCNTCSFIQSTVFVTASLEQVSRASISDRKKDSFPLSDGFFLHAFVCQVSAEFIESWIPGGKATGAYEHAVYWAAEAKQFETYMKFLQEEFIVKSQEQRMAEAKAFQEAQAAGKTAAQAAEEAARVQSCLKAGSSSSSGSSATPGSGGGSSGVSTVARAASTKSVEDAVLFEKDEGEEDVQDEEEEEEESSPELNEDEQKRKMLQEALRKEQEHVAAVAAGAAKAEDGEKEGPRGGGHLSQGSTKTESPKPSSLSSASS